MSLFVPSHVQLYFSLGLFCCRSGAKCGTEASGADNCSRMKYRIARGKKLLIKKIRAKMETDKINVKC